MGESVKKIEGQCGTCSFAKEFCSGSYPSDPEDYVHCISKEMASRLDGPPPDSTCHPDTREALKRELEEYGYLNLWRLEILAEETFRCPCWQASDDWKAETVKGKDADQPR